MIAEGNEPREIETYDSRTKRGPVSMFPVPELYFVLLECPPIQTLVVIGGLGVSDKWDQIGVEWA